MLARIQQLIVLTLVCSAIAAFAMAARADRAWLGFAFVVFVVGAYGGVLASEFWLLRRSYAPDDPERPRAGQLLRAWAVEVLVAPRVFLWRQPFRSASEPDHLPSNARGRIGVVLVHGFFCNRGLWNPWLRRMRAFGIPFSAVTLEPVFGSIDDYCRAIGTAMAALEHATEQAPIIVAHSMGGLAVRAWLDANADARVHRLVTIATPHGGTRLAMRGRGRNVAQMRHGSAWLGELGRRDATTSRTQVVCFWSHCDNIVFPTRGATLPGADNRHLEGTPHVAMVYHPAVIDDVLRAAGAIAAPEPR
jgi:triacylglycerol esterase/lipase EstA (alpha/beta hydrolase family)